MLSGVETSELPWQIVENRIRRLKEVAGHAGVVITIYTTMDSTRRMYSMGHTI